MVEVVKDLSDALKALDDLEKNLKRLGILDEKERQMIEVGGPLNCLNRRLGNLTNFAGIATVSTLLRVARECTYLRGRFLAQSLVAYLIIARVVATVLAHWVAGVVLGAVARIRDVVEKSTASTSSRSRNSRVDACAGVVNAYRNDVGALRRVMSELKSRAKDEESFYMYVSFDYEYGCIKVEASSRRRAHRLITEVLERSARLFRKTPEVRWSESESSYVVCVNRDLRRAAERCIKYLDCVSSGASSCEKLYPDWFASWRVDT